MLPPAAVFLIHKLEAYGTADQEICRTRREALISESSVACRVLP